jgi:PAS domain S-box-containing protein
MIGTDASNALEILVVEDDADARANLRDILELDGHQITMAGSAVEALGRRDLVEFSAVILDRKLPDATADDLLPLIRRHAPRASVIIVTGYSDLQGAIAALRQGATDYILKPLNPEALRASLSRIADRRRLTKAKERSEAAFRQLVEAAECMIVIIRPDRSIVYFNPYAARVTGYSIDEVVGSRGESSATQGVRETIGELFDHGLADGGAAIDQRKPLICRDGSSRWIVWKARRLEGYDGAPAFLLVGQDITDLKHAQARALQSERLAAIGQMVTGLAHESRNALQRAQACLEMLAIADQGRPRSLDLISRVQRAQDDLYRLFEDVRSYAAPIRLDRVPLDPVEVWREVWADLEPQRLGRDATIRESIPEDRPTFSVDRFRLGQVFRNLFDNALAACHDPVEIDIHFELVDDHGREAARISIRDNGPGFDPEFAANLFEPFYTTKTKGTGLGLAIARRIVEAHGGRIEAGATGASGAEVIITIPRDDL